MCSDESTKPTSEAIVEFRINKIWFFYIIAYSVAIVTLLPRLEGFEYYHGKYLWAEDGNVFLNQAQATGIWAILDPYAGYLHFYPRIVAEFSQLFDLFYRPTVLLAGWFLAYFILVHALASIVLKQGGSIFSMVAIIGLSSLQPNYGEVFFNITNSQWLLGAALIIYVLDDLMETLRAKIIKGALLFPLTLTGPFSIILTPILTINIFAKKDFYIRKYIYLPVFLGALIQATVFFYSDRASSGEINKDPWEWILAFLKMFFFGANNVYTLFAALLIWLLIAYLVYATARNNKHQAAFFSLPLLFLLASDLIILAGLFSHKENPGAIVSLGSGNRYSWIPYVLIFTSVIMLAQGRKIVGTIVIILSTFICFKGFHGVHGIHSPSLQFEAFAKYSQSQDVVIPIHPQWPTFPGWHINGRPNARVKNPGGGALKINLNAVSWTNLVANFVDGQLEVNSTNNDPILTFKHRLLCPRSSHAALEIHLMREKEGWLQLFWSEEGQFNEDKSLRRWYPSGKVIAQFAFPISSTGTYLRFDPQENIGFSSIQKTEMHCL